MKKWKKRSRIVITDKCITVYDKKGKIRVRIGQW